ncbi:MAG: hypothetical protein WDA16_07675 [Candidatus Thermoplasmatota archaeon]
MTDVVLALGFDLFFKPRITQAAKEVGVEVRFVLPAEALAKSEGTSRVVADVSAPGVLDAVLSLRKARPELPVLVCYPHVQADLMQAAVAAGASAVTRGQFNADLPKMMRG